MSQQEHNHKEVKGKNLFIASILNLIIAVAEVIGGILSNSLSLISDALHNLSDGLAVLIAYVANRVGKRKSNERKTFGYKRIEIIAALFNSGVLVVISFYLFYEAVRRFSQPEVIDGRIMFIVAIIGLLANVISVIILHKDSAKNINVRAAYIHLIGDTLSSVAVIIGGILIIFWEVYWVDPLITILIGLYILRESWKIFREAIDILMQGAPRNIDITKITNDISKIGKVADIHHVHSWILSDEQTHFECHIDLENDIKVSEAETIRDQIEKYLLDAYGINHITIQFEYKWCGDKSIIPDRG